MKRKRMRSFMAAAMALVLMLAGCGGGAAEKAEQAGSSDAPAAESSASAAESSAEASNDGEVTTVEYVFWGNQTEINTIMGTIDAFNASHTDIQVKGTGMDSSVYLQKLSAYASSNTLPDIVQVAIDYGDEYTKR